DKYGRKTQAWYDADERWRRRRERYLRHEQERRDGKRPARVKKGAKLEYERDEDEEEYYYYELRYAPPPMQMPMPEVDVEDSDSPFYRYGAGPAYAPPPEDEYSQWDYREAGGYWSMPHGSRRAAGSSHRQRQEYAWYEYSSHHNGATGQKDRAAHASGSRRQPQPEYGGYSSRHNGAAGQGNGARHASGSRRSPQPEHGWYSPPHNGATGQRDRAADASSSRHHPQPEYGWSSSHRHNDANGYRGRRSEGRNKVPPPGAQSRKQWDDGGRRQSGKTEYEASSYSGEESEPECDWGNNGPETNSNFSQDRTGQQRSRSQRPPQPNRAHYETPPKPQDYYAILGISPDSNQEEIKTAAKKMRVKVHPDRMNLAAKTEEEKQKIHEKAAQVGQAADVLSDPRKREEYDRKVADWEAMFGSG
ncbi:MAG: hypothetical protein Q9191_007868, partial [Dirinaria sp. TL-2023a]